jgi:hypothetical protein
MDNNQINACRKAEAEHQIAVDLNNEWTRQLQLVSQLTDINHSIKQRLIIAKIFSCDDLLRATFNVSISHEIYSAHSASLCSAFNGMRHRQCNLSIESL